MYCRKCNTWWELCWRIPKKEQKDDKSKKKKGDQRSRSKSVHQEGKAASSSKDPLMPFVPLKEPWVSTTPDSRVKAEVHGAFPGPRLPGPKEPVSEMCDKIRTFLYHKKDKIPEELTSSLSDFVKEEDQMLKHSHVNKLANLRRAAEKLLVKIKTTDQEWTDFQKTLKDRFDSQKASYLKTRAGLVKQFKEKKQEFLDHRALVQSLAAGGDLGEDGDAPEDVTFGDLAQMPETVNLEEEEEEEEDLVEQALSPRQCWLVYLAYFDPFCHFLVEQCTFLLVLECRMFLLGSVAFSLWPVRRKKKHLCICGRRRLVRRSIPPRGSGLRCFFCLYLLLWSQVEATCSGVRPASQVSFDEPFGSTFSGRDGVSDDHVLFQLSGLHPWPGWLQLSPMPNLPVLFPEEIREQRAFEEAVVRVTHLRDFPLVWREASAFRDARGAWPFFTVHFVDRSWQPCGFSLDGDDDLNEDALKMAIRFCYQDLPLAVPLFAGLVWPQPSPFQQGGDDQIHLLAVTFLPSFHRFPSLAVIDFGFSVAPSQVMRPVVTSATVTFDEFVQAVEMVGVCVWRLLARSWWKGLMSLATLLFA